MVLKVILDITFTIICTAIAIIDIQKQTIYNEAVAVLLVPAIVSFFVWPEIGAVSRLLGAVSVSGIMLLMCLLIPGAFGGGDIKLIVPVGLFLGAKRTVAAWLLAVLFGTLWGVGAAIWAMWKARLSEGEKAAGKEKIGPQSGIEFPFGPALCMGSVLALQVGDRIWELL